MNTGHTRIENDGSMQKNFQQPRFLSYGHRNLCAIKKHQIIFLVEPVDEMVIHNKGVMDANEMRDR